MTTELEKSLLLEGELAEKSYENKICKGCIGTKQQIDRNCSALKGGYLSCKFMGNSVKNRKAYKQAKGRAIQELKTKLNQKERK